MQAQNFVESARGAVQVEPLPHPVSLPEREFVKVMLVGSPQAVTQTMRVLYLRGFAEIWEWSPLLPTQVTGEVMVMLRRVVV
ncbi:MAG: peptide ABC transporter substrate-binding protein [Cyanobacteria bacterium P01_G01_bin.54]